MVKSINVQSPVVHFKKFGSKNLQVNRDGSIREFHDRWNDPLPKLPETKPKNHFKPPPYIPYKHPPDYLRPTGGGFYTTPTDDPKISDPQNCNGNLADISPWCGGNPLTIEPVGLEIELAYDECNVWIEISPTLAFLKLPPGQIAYRFPGKCREEPPPDPPKTADPGKKTYRKPKGLDPLASVFAFVGNDYGSTTIGQQYVEGNFIYKYRTFAYLSDWKFSWTDFKCPGTVDLYDMANSGFYYNSPITGFFEFTTTINNVDTYEGQTEADSSSNTSTGKGEWDTTGGWGVYYPYIAISEDGKVISYRTKDGSITQVQPVGTPIYGVFEAIGNGALTHQTGIFKGSWQIIDLYLGAVEAPISTSVNEMPAGESTTTGYSNIHVDLVIGQNCGSAKNRNRLPPPPKRDRDCCMACCNQSPQDNSLLREILAQIRLANKAIGSDKFPVQATIFDENENKQEAQSKNIRLNDVASSITKIIDRNEKISKIIGIDTFPLELPESVIVHPENDNIFTKALNFLNPFKNVKINSVMDLLVWKIKQDSAVLGQWGQVIQVTSTEKKKVTVDGKQIEKDIEKTEEVVLPNIAQTMKETILLQSQLLKNNGLVLDCVIKLLIELAQTKSISAESLKRVEDIQQYLDYPTNEITVDVPVQITFPNPSDPVDVQNDLYKLLKEGHIRITFDDWTGEHSQDEKFLDLLQAAKVIQGVYFNKT
jgi:hypothetical protein